VTAGFDESRLAEIIVFDQTGRGRRGTGYLVAESTVLTAAHVVSAATSIVVRFDGGLATERSFQGSAAFRDEVADLALLELLAAQVIDGVIAPVWLGKPRAGSYFIDAHIAGFPLWKRRRRRGPDGRLTAFRELHHAEARIAAASNRRTGRWELRVTAPLDELGDTPSPWEGMSGAPVWASDHLIGVVTEHHRHEGAGWLTAVDLARHLDSPDGSRLGQVLGRPSVIRPLATIPLGEIADATPWMVPRTVETLVERPVLSGRLRNLIMEGRNSPVGLTTGLTGAGGFGKTTLASLVCSDPALRDRFPGGLLWITLGESLESARLAGKINDLSERLTGKRPTLSDPEQAGLKLAEVLAGRPDVLLVIDDAWNSGQLRPLLIGGPNCRRLITTRIMGILPAGATTVVVDAMERGEARELLLRAISAVPPNLETELLALTYRWPVLLAIANGALRKMISIDADPAAAAKTLVRRLKGSGPAALDLRRAEERHEAVRLTVEAGLDLLTPDGLDSLLDLAIFPEGTDIPVGILASWWHHSRGHEQYEVLSLIDELIELSLLGRHFGDPENAVVRIHDVLRSYLRWRLPAGQLTKRSRSFIKAMRTLLPADDAPSAWWRLDHGENYLWRYLPSHLADADYPKELVSLVLDLRWVSRKIEVLGSAAWVRADLGLIDAPQARRMSEAIAGAVHVLAPDRTGGMLEATLVSRLDHIPELATTISDFTDRLARPLLRRRWPLPDQPSEPTPANGSSRHSGWIRGCAVSPDERSIATYSNDQTVRLWSLVDGSEKALLAGHLAGVRSCAFSPDGTWLVSAGNDRTVRRWDTVSGALLSTFRGHVEPVCSCAVAPDGTWLASAAEDAAVGIWDVVTGELRRLLKGHNDWVDGCAIFPDGARLATASADATVRLWDQRSGEQIARLAGHEGGVRGCAISPDGLLVASAGSDCTVRIWDVARSEVKHVLSGHTQPVNSCSFAPSGRWAVSSSSDGTVRTWDVENGHEIAALRQHAGAVRVATIAASGSFVASAGRDDGVLVTQPVSSSGRPIGEPIRRRIGIRLSRSESAGHTDWVAHCAASADGLTVATSGADATVRIWDSTAQTITSVLRGHAGGVRCSAISRDASWVLSAGADGTGRIWDRKSSTVIHMLKGHDGGVRYCAIGPDDDLVATVGNDTTVRLWSKRTGEAHAVLRGHESGVRSCAIAPSGRWLLSTGSDAMVRVWDLKALVPVATLPGHDSVVRSCVISRDETWAASVGVDGIRIWDIDGWRLRRVLNGHQGGVRGCDADPTGRWLASVSTDQTLRVWNVASGDCAAAVRVGYSLSGCAWLAETTSICAVGEGGVYMFTFDGVEA